MKVTDWQIKRKERLFVRTKIECVYYGEKKNYELDIHKSVHRVYNQKISISWYKYEPNQQDATI